MGNNSHHKAVCVGCISFVGLFLIVYFIIWLSTGLNSLDNNEMGLRYSSWSKTIESGKLYREGTHTFGAWNSFKIFPRDKISESFGNRSKILTARTKDGMAISIAVTYQYYIKESYESVSEIFYQWGESSYKEAFKLITRSVLRTVCAEYDAITFIYDKQTVKNKLVSDLTTSYDELGLRLDNFAFGDIIYPSAFSTVIVDIEKEKIEINKVRNEKERIINEMNGKVSRAEIEKGVLTTQAEIEGKNAESILKNEKSTYDTLVTGLIPVWKEKEAVYSTELWAKEILDVLNKKGTVNYFPPTPGAISSLFVVATV